MQMNMLKNYVNQILNLEIDRMVLKKTNKIIEKVYEEKNKIFQDELESLNADLLEAEQDKANYKTLCEKVSVQQPKNYWQNLLDTFRYDVDWNVMDEIAGSFIILLFTIPAFFAGYWLIGKWFLSTICGVDVALKTRIILGTVLGGVGLRKGVYFITDMDSGTFTAGLLVKLYWATIGFFIGYWLIGQWILSNLFNINIGMTVQIILGIVLCILGFFVGIARCESLSLVDWLDMIFLFPNTKKKDIENIKFCRWSFEQQYRDAVKKCEKLEKQKTEYLSHQNWELETQIEVNRRNIEHIGEILDKYYALDILPPDYRTIDCIITLDHIFQNNLADTMREAILLYKNWLFQGMIIEGIDKIYSLMGNLSDQMKYMQITLDNIEENTNSMYNDLSNLLELQEKQGRTQEKLLEESKCTRYAAESIKRSNEKYEWYVEQHRQGLL